MARQSSALIICCAAVAASSGAQAVGFGRVTPSAVLGQPLNVVVPVQLDQGERLFAECVQAEVTAGDSPLLPSQVRVSVQATANPSEWIARVTTTVPIMEPLVEVGISAGCERRFMRRFTAFADPPVGHAANVPAVLPQGGIDAPSRAFQVQSQAAAAAGGTGKSTGRSGHSAAAASPRPQRSVVAKPASPAPSARVARAAAMAAPREEQVARLLLDVGAGPRLRMDIEEPVFMPASAAASGGLDGTASDLDRLILLEKTLGDLKKETQTYRNNEAGLKAKLAEAESRSRLLPWLLGLALLAVAAVVALLWRGRKAGTAAVAAPAPAAETGEQPWWQSEGGRPGKPAATSAESADATDSVVSGAMLLGDAPEVPADTFPISPYERTQPFSAADSLAASVGLSSIADGQIPAREVSVEELLDLEQQADFFIALGQEDAAIDLLMSHLRGTGGQSPLPYTKLLEIYRRQGDRSAYERIRARFNRRFNAYAPDWDQGPLHGRSLEDYPDVVQRLEGLWSSPLNAMAVLEALLFRNDDTQELFDLPAYKDVLLLYSLARDLYQQSGVQAEDVDLLLPLGDDGLFPSSGGEHEAGGVIAEAGPGDKGYDLTAFSLEVPTPDMAASIQQLRGSEPGKPH